MKDARTTQQVPEVGLYDKEALASVLKNGCHRVRISGQEVALTKGAHDGGTLTLKGTTIDPDDGCSVFLLNGEQLCCTKVFGRIQEHVRAVTPKLAVTLPAGIRNGKADKGSKASMIGLVLTKSESPLGVIDLGKHVYGLIPCVPEFLAIADSAAATA